MKDMQFKDGDLNITNDINLVSGNDELIQSITLVLSIFKGEFAPEPTIGTDYNSHFFKKYSEENVQGMRMDIQAALEQEPRIQTINNIDLNLDETTRHLIVNLSLKIIGDENNTEMEVDLNAI